MFNYDNLRIVSVHEVYPGHFVHYLHNRYGRDLPLVNRVATSYAFVEGWAHYCEQMMVETEYGAGQPVLHLTQLLEALVRNCRFLCSIWMHTQGMSVDAADLTRADLSGANLRGADLTDANLDSVDLSGADLTGTDLQVADLSRANLDSVIGGNFLGALNVPDKYLKR